jgi:hypothetical protein
MMPEAKQLEQALRTNIQYFYEALRWGGVELDVRAEQLQCLLRGLERRLAREEAVSRPLTQTPENFPLYTLLRTGKGALRVAQEMGSLQVPLGSEEAGESLQQIPIALLPSLDGRQAGLRSVGRG